MVERKQFLPMLRWISILGGLVIMMGQHDRSEALFHYSRLTGQDPGNHPPAAHRKSTSALNLCALEALQASSTAN
jgi:hypothetical protein